MISYYNQTFLHNIINKPESMVEINKRCIGGS